MTRYVHITDECRTEAQGLGLESRLSKIKEQIETAQNLSGFDFLSATVLKKKVGRPFRLIARLHAIAGDELVIFARLLLRRRADYPRQLEVVRDTTPYSDDDLKRIYSQLKTAPVLTENQQQARKQSDRAEQLRRSWNLNDSDIDDYPTVRTPKEDQAGYSIPAEMGYSFWDSPDLDTLLRSQNVEPLSDIRELYGTWPGDESDDFEAEIDALRHSDYGHEDP